MVDLSTLPPATGVAESVALAINDRNQVAGVSENAAGIPHDHPAMRRAVAWLESVQNDDGGFGEDCRSYDEGERGAAWRGRGESTASQTAWALLGLVAAGEAESDAATRATAWLAATQRDDGDWDEPYFTGTGFPRHFLINYHLYRTYWPVMALGRLKAALA